MTTQLSRQLDAIRSSNLVSSGAGLHRGRYSLFLSPKESASVDIGECYEAAKQGLQILSQYDERFELFLGNLLHPSNIELQRELKTKQENHDLDLEIISLLKLLSVFGSNSNSHLVLEYLIQQYRVNELNSRSLISYFIFIHDSKIFAKIIQISNIDKSIWSFLEGVKQSGSPLPRSTLVQRCLKDVAVFQQICSSIQSIMKITCESKQSFSKSQIFLGAHHILSFFTTVVMEMTAIQAISDSHMRVLVPYIMEGLQSPNVESPEEEVKEFITARRRSICMIIVQISHKTQYTKPLMKIIFQSLTSLCIESISNDSLHPQDNVVEYITTMAALCEHNQIDLLSKSVLLKLFPKTASSSASTCLTILQVMQLISAEYDMSIFIQLIIHSCQHYIKKKVQLCHDWSVKTSNSSILNIPKQASEVTALLQIMQLLFSKSFVDPQNIQLFCKEFLSNIIQLLPFPVSNDESCDTHLPSIESKIYSFIGHCSQKYPIELEHSIHELYSEMRTNHLNSDAIQSFDIFINNAFANNPLHLYNEQGMGSFLSLKSSIPQIQIQTLRNLPKTAQQILKADEKPTADELLNATGFVEALTDCFCENTLDVALTCWQLDVFSSYLDLCTMLIKSNKIDDSYVWDMVYRVMSYWLAQTFPTLLVGLSPAISSSNTTISLIEFNNNMGILSLILGCITSEMTRLWKPISKNSKDTKNLQSLSSWESIHFILLNIFFGSCNLIDENLHNRKSFLTFEHNVMRFWNVWFQQLPTETFFNGVVRLPKETRESSNQQTIHQNMIDTIINRIVNSSNPIDSILQDVKLIADFIMKLVCTTTDSVESLPLSIPVNKFIIKLILDLCKRISGSTVNMRAATKGPLANFIADIIETATPVVLRQLETSNRLTHETKLTLEMYSMTQTLIESCHQSKLLNGQFGILSQHRFMSIANNVTHMNEIISSLLTPLPHDNVSVLILIQLLEMTNHFDSDHYLSNLGSCCKMLFSPNELIHTLLKFCFERLIPIEAKPLINHSIIEHTDLSVVTTDTASYNIDRVKKLRISSYTLSGALQILSSLIASSIKSDESLIWRMIFLLFPVILYHANSQYSYLRQSACTLAGRINAWILPKRPNLHVFASALMTFLSGFIEVEPLSATTNSSTSRKVSPQSQENVLGNIFDSIASACQYFSEHEHIINLEQQIPTYHLDQIRSQMGSNHYAFESLISRCCVAFAWRLSHFTSSLLLYLPANSLTKRKVVLQLLQCIVESVHNGEMALFKSTAILNPIEFSALQPQLEDIVKLGTQLVRMVSHETYDSLDNPSMEITQKLTSLLTSCRLGCTQVDASKKLFLMPLYRSVYDEVIKMIIEDGMAAFSKESKELLIRTLVSEQMIQSGRNDIRLAIEKVERVNMNLIFQLLLTATEVFMVDCEAMRTSKDKTISDIKEDEDEIEGHVQGFSVPIKVLITSLEVLLPILQNSVTDDDALGNPSETTPLYVSTVTCRMFTILTIINQEVSQSVLMLDYVKELLLDVLQVCVQSESFKSSLETTAVPESYQSSRSKSKAMHKSIKLRLLVDECFERKLDYLEVNSLSYSIHRVEGDIEAVLQSFGFSHEKASNQNNNNVSSLSNHYVRVNSKALYLLQSLIQINHDTLLPAVRMLGEILSRTTVLRSFNIGSNTIVGQILQAFFNLADRMSQDGDVSLYQDIMQYLCENFQNMPPLRRSQLITTAVKTIRPQPTSMVVSYPCMMTLTASVLLVHSIVSFENECSATQTWSELATNTLMLSGNTKLSSTVLISKASHRKFNRQLKSSTQEQFYQLAEEQVLTMPVSDILQTLRMMICTIIDYTSYASNTSKTNSDDSRSPHGTGATQLINTEKLIDYLVKLRSSHTNQWNDDAGSNQSICRGYSATLAILQSELVSDVLKHNKFHLKVAKLLDGFHEDFETSQKSLQSNAFIHFQESFLQLTDGVFQLLAIANQIKLTRDGGTSEIQLNFQENLSLPIRSLGNIIETWCHDNLDVLQRIVDLPTFIVILQELIQHEQYEVRQSALMYLSSKLETMKGNAMDIQLYIDLVMQLRFTIKELSDSGLENENKLKMGIMQSSIMCIDIIARSFSNYRGEQGVDGTVDMKTEWFLTLSQFVEMISQLMKSNESDTHQLSVDKLKLLGSLFLCCATVYGMIHKSKILAQLPLLMGYLKRSLKENLELVMGSMTISSESSIKNKRSRTVTAADASLIDGIVIRSKVLLLRSIIASLTLLSRSIFNFIHPYLSDLLILSAQLFNADRLPESNSLDDDIKTFMSSIAKNVPVRLAISPIINAMEQMLASSHGSAYVFMYLVEELCHAMDRNATIMYINQMSSLFIFCMDYHRLHGDASASGDTVDEQISQAVVAWCLKLTESELKVFIHKVAEWRDSSSSTTTIVEDGTMEAEGQLTRDSIARSISFYSLVSSLLNKLGVIFVPTMSMLWNPMATLLLTTHQYIEMYLTSKATDELITSNSINKRKKSTDVDYKGMKSESERKEIISLLNNIMNGVTLTCQNDSLNLIDEELYQQMISPIIELFPLRNLYNSDEEYMDQCMDVFIPTIIALNFAVNKDTAWKPTNYKILLITRNKSKIVKMVAVQLIQSLFKDIGEEYLSLLPECLPFLSELLEDEHDDVRENVKETLRFIEELSGEKLEDYL